MIPVNDSYLELKFNVVHAADETVYAVCEAIRTFNLGPTSLFIEFRSSTSSGISLKNFDHPQFLSLMYKLSKSKLVPGKTDINSADSS